ncbi:MAG: paaK [Verrucomicrobiales bacterium]|nr:paaK [Verrucomicrobiales bacterium]
MANPFPTRDEIESFQLVQLRRVLEQIQPANKFYARKLSGIETRVSSLKDFSDRFPFTTKQELSADQVANPPFGTNLTHAVDEYTRYCQTSGTTREPLRWLDTKADWQWMVDSWKRIYTAAGVNSADRIYFAFSFGPFIGFWLAFDAAQQIGSICIPGGGLSTAARLRAMRDSAATVICCTPSYAIRLGEVAAEEKISLTSIRLVIVAGEPGGSIPATRKRIEQLWPTARIFDHHGMTETGPVTFECPQRPGILHVIESSYLTEILNTDGHAVAPGEPGELVLTPLGRSGSPLLRYKTGDMVKAVVQSRCQCGRSDLALDGGILGRIDDMIVVRGVNVYPSGFEDLLRRFPQIAEYQVEVDKTKTLAEIHLQIELASDVASVDQIATQIQTAIQDTFHLRVPVTLVGPGTLPRYEMKARRWTVRAN